jgi:hypothetical protein
VTARRLVVHCKRGIHQVYVGRPTKWGNPHPVGWCNLCRLNHDRREAVALYEEHLRASPKLMEALHELRGKVLGCWCAPQACHADVLARLANG